MRIAKFAFAAVIVLSLTICAAAQSVADAARQPKPTKKAAKVYTNDEIPSVETSKDADAAKSADSNAPDNDAKADDKDAKTDDKPSDGKTADKKEATPEDSKKLEGEWKTRIATQKTKIADNERELQITDREYKLRSAVFFADAGNRLRDDKKWADTERKYKEDMARLQQDLISNKAKLEDLREEARKSGVKAE